MITIKGKDATIEIDIMDITNSGDGYDYIKCNFYYKGNNIFFTSNNIIIYNFELKDLYQKLKDIKRKLIEHYLFKADRDVVSIDFTHDQPSSDFILYLKFFHEWESNTFLQSSLRISEEQMQDFIQEIHHLILLFKGTTS